MNAKQFYQKHAEANEPLLEAVAKSAGTTLGNFKQIALYGGACSSRLAKRLSEASGGEMTLTAILFPDEDSAA